MKEHPFYKKKETINTKRQELLDSFYEEVKLMSKYKIPNNGLSFFRDKLKEDKPFISNEKLNSYSLGEMVKKSLGDDMIIYQEIVKRCHEISWKFLSLHFKLIDKNKSTNDSIKKLKKIFSNDGLDSFMVDALVDEISDLNDLIIKRDEGKVNLPLYKLNKIIDSLFSIFEHIRLDYFRIGLTHKYSENEANELLVKSLPIWNSLPFFKNKLFYIEKNDLNGIHLNSIKDELFMDITSSLLYWDIRTLRNYTSHGTKIFFKDKEFEDEILKMIGVLLMYMINYSKKTTKMLKEKNMLSEIEFK